MSRPTWKTVLLLAAACIAMGCSETDDSNLNLRGNVTLDGEIVQGVTIEVEDDSGARAETMTDVRGAYGFALEPGEKTVSILAGIPGDAQCSPGTEQDVTVPAEGFVDADFACETPGGGGGGTGGTGGAGGGGGMGGTGAAAGGAGGSGGNATGLAACDAVVSLDAECECDPFSETACDQPSSNLQCSHTLYVDDMGAIIGMPALDGSEDAWATECVSDLVQEDGEGASCFVQAGSGGPATPELTRRDTCIQGFHCENPDGREQGTCVRLCASSSDCSGGTCSLFDTGSSGVTLGRCL